LSETGIPTQDLRPSSLLARFPVKGMLAERSCAGPILILRAIHAEIDIGFGLFEGNPAAE